MAGSPLPTRLQQLLEDHDRIMALPNEDVNSYSQRMQTAWSLPRGKRWCDVDNGEGVYSSSSPSPEGSKRRGPFTPEDADIEMRSSPELSHQAAGIQRDIENGVHDPSFEPFEQVRDIESHVDVSAIEEFSDSVEVPNSPVSPGLPQAQSLSPIRDNRPTSSRKRSALPLVSSNKRRRVISDSAVNEDINSMDKTSRTPPNRPGRHVIKARGTAITHVPRAPSVPATEKSATVRLKVKCPNFVANKGKKTTSREAPAHLCSSPIEDPSAILPGPSKGVVGRSTSLVEEMKARITRHRTSKPRFKTVSLGTKDHTPRSQTAALGDESSIASMPSSSASSRESSPFPSAVKSTGEVEKPKGGRVPDPVVEKLKQKARLQSLTNTKKKQTAVPMAPAEYTQSLQSGLEVPLKLKSNFLEGYRIFYTGGDMRTVTESTRRRMNLVVQHGGTLVPVFDADVVSHIVTDASAGSTVQALGLKRLDDIPNHIPTVKWTWVVKGIANVGLKKKAMDKLLESELWNHAAFSSRLDAGMKSTMSFKLGAGSKGKRREKSKTIDVDESVSLISNFTQDQIAPVGSSTHVSAVAGPSGVMGGNAHVGSLPSPPSSPSQLAGGKGESNLDRDPLAPFYDQAKAERLQEGAGVHDSDESDVEVTLPQSTRQRRGWTCDKKSTPVTDCPNQDIIDKLVELQELHRAKPTEDDKWRVFAYSKATRALKTYPKRITSYEEAKKIPNVGEKTAQKIAEILATGQLRRIKYETTEDVKATRLFQGIYGVGQATAYQWFHAGIRTLEDLKQGKFGVKLSPPQKIGLEFYDDINSRMPREEAKALFDLIKPIALSLDPMLSVDIMGSYRRGKPTCGDIDILITRPPDDGKTHSGVLHRLLQELRNVGILTEDLAFPEDPRDLEGVYRGLCRLPNVPGARRRRIDFLTVPYQCRGAALIYYTGDDIFNRAMRMKANHMGYSLNQRGLWQGVIRDPSDRRIKLNTGTIIASETEEEIFRILKIPWQEPHERVRNHF